MTIPTAVTVKEAAQALSVHVATLYRHEAKGLIRFARIGSATRVPVSELERILSGTPEPVGAPVGEPRKRRIHKIKLIPRVSE